MGFAFHSLLIFRNLTFLLLLIPFFSPPTVRSRHPEWVRAIRKAAKYDADFDVEDLLELLPRGSKAPGGSAVPIGDWLYRFGIFFERHLWSLFFPFILVKKIRRDIFHSICLYSAVVNLATAIVQQGSNSCSTQSFYFFWKASWKLNEWSFFPLAARNNEGIVASDPKFPESDFGATNRWTVHRGTLSRSGCQREMLPPPLWCFVLPPFGWLFFVDFFGSCSEIFKFFLNVLLQKKLKDRSIPLRA